jgi:hypothetical protein
LVRGSKAKYRQKQKRLAEHIEEAALARARRGH